MPMPIEKQKTILAKEGWHVQRFGRIEEIHYDSGRIIYRVKIWDAGREPFVTETFNDEGPAYNFLERVRDENLAAHDEVDK